MLNKIYLVENLVKKIKVLKLEGKKIGICHGLFDLIHPGHIYHLIEAKKHCDVLIVSTTADKFVRKNLNGPFFNEKQRKFFLSNLNIVDFVCSTEDPTSIQVLKKIKPHFYFKGEEYKIKDSIGNLKLENEFCKQNKIKIKFIGKRHFSSSQLISKHLYVNEDKKLKELLLNLKKKNIEVENILKKAKNKKILIIGEVIFDRYTYLKTTGVSSKSSSLSGSIISKVTMPGGILSCIDFLRQFSKKVDCLSLINKNVKKNKFRLSLIKNKNKIFYSNKFPEIIKERLIQEDSNTLSKKKLFTVNHFENIAINNKDENKILRYLKKNIKKYDLVIVQDFGHGLISKKIADLIVKKSNYLSLNVQTNSTNYGFNYINRKFSRSNVFTLDQNEIRVYARDENPNYKNSLKKLKKELKSDYGFLTLGDKFSICDGKKKSIKINSLEKNVVDAVGAGDIFHSFASLLTVLTNEEILILLLAQISGALSVKIVGNERTPTYQEIVNTFNFYMDSVGDNNL